MNAMRPEAALGDFQIQECRGQRERACGALWQLGRPPGAPLLSNR